MFRHHILTLALALLAAACSSGDEVEAGRPDEGGAICFSTTGTTRAVGLETLHTHFGVWVTKVMADNSSLTVMDGYDVEYVTSRPSSGGTTWGSGEGRSYWSYDHIAGQTLKYWDMAASRYVFAAVAPNPSTVTTTSTVSVDGDGKITFNLKDLQTDWMAARTVRTMATPEDRDDIEPSHQFATINTKSAEVPLNFHRILSKVVFKAYADDEMEIDPLEVGFAHIGSTPAGYSTADGWTTKTNTDYQKVYDNGGAKTVIAAENNSRETAKWLTELYVIPQTLTAGETPVVNIIVKQENDATQTVTLNIPGSWEPNKIYTYYLKFDAFDPTEVILFEVTVDDWEKGNEDDKEDDEHNW